MKKVSTSRQRKHCSNYQDRTVQSEILPKHDLPAVWWVEGKSPYV